MKCPTEVQITDRREKELADLGFAPVVHCKDTDYAAFFSVQSCQKPKLYDQDSANANARLSTHSFRTSWLASRFAHYPKADGRCATRLVVSCLVSRPKPS